MLKEESNEATGTSLSKAFNGPVYFLIREQAKSVVAIKELQTRLTLLEDLQERLMQAVYSVQNHLITGKNNHDDKRSDYSYSATLPAYSSTQQLRPSSVSDSDIKQQFLHLIPSTKNDSKGESINKDSGVVSDYKENSADSSYVPYNSSERQIDGENDELLKLLDIIDQKSLLLLQQVEDVESKTAEIPKMNDGNEMTSSDSNSHAENVITQRQLFEVKADRDDLKERLEKLEMATDTAVREKTKLQKKLENVVSENQQLQMKIQHAGNANTFSAEHIGSFSLKSSLADMQKDTVRRKYMQYSEMSRAKVAKVLKETQVLELQRQLLTYIMENDILQAKLGQSEPNSLLPWLKLESQLKNQLQNANEDKRILEKALREKHSEISNLKNRIQVLEETLEQEETVKNFGLGSTDDWRQPNGENPKGNLNGLSPLAFGDFSKTQSLPAAVRLDTGGGDIQTKHFEQEFNTKYFTDVSLNNSPVSGERLNFFSSKNKDKNLVDLTDNNESEVSNTSTLLHLYYQNQPAISADWSTTDSLPCSRHRSNHVCHPNLIRPNSAAREASSKLINGHLCWKGEMDNLANDLDSICTEFDPLSSTTPSCENFVDSLNLSIPLKPTQVVSQLSSIGDSLHSASLDLGCASSTVWRNDNPKLPSASSVDGIRKLMIDSSTPGYYKNRTSQSSAQNNTSITSVMSGRTIHPRPMNIMECMQNITDNKLL